MLAQGKAKLSKEVNSRRDLKSRLLRLRREELIELKLCKRSINTHNTAITRLLNYTSRLVTQARLLMLLLPIRSCVRCWEVIEGPATKAAGEGSMRDR